MSQNVHDSGHCLRYCCIEQLGQFARTAEALLESKAVQACVAPHSAVGRKRSCFRPWPLVGLKPTVMTLVESLPERFAALRPLLDERARRIWAAAEARAMGRGGISRVSEATGLSRTTIRSGLRELAKGPPQARGRVRRPGGGRKPAIVKDPQLCSALELKFDPVVRGFPLSPLRWTCRSSESLAQELRAEGRNVSGRTVNRLLHRLGYRLRGNRKMMRGTDRDRERQFEHINQRVEQFHAYGQPAIWVCFDKQAYLAQNNGGGAAPGQPGDANSYGIPELTANTGWTSVKFDRGTAGFAVEALGRWWQEISRTAYPSAERLLVAAEDGGSNNGPSPTWRAALQDLADDLGIRIAVCHMPPGTSKWTKIENRLFSQKRQHAPGQPLVGHEVMAHFVGEVTPRSGPSMRFGSGGRERGDGPFSESSQVRGETNGRDAFLRRWNYTVRPRN